jgi:hypothetical protein
MVDFFKQITIGQFEASLAMLKQCIESCREELWESPVAALTVRQIAYHTLFFVDFYLTEDEASFALRKLHESGGDEREPVVSPGLSKEATLAYFPTCLEKIQSTLGGETEASLCGPSGFSWLQFSRGELHLYNIRHVQHHAGQLSAHLRRLESTCRDRDALRWVATGWK